MSNTKLTKAIKPATKPAAKGKARALKAPKAAPAIVVTVTADQFNSSLTLLAMSFKDAKAAIKTCAIYITEQVNYKDQQAAIKAVSEKYAAFAGADKKAAHQWVMRQCKAVKDGFKPLKSQSAQAQEKAKRRARTAEKAAEIEQAKKPVKATVTPIDSYRTKLIEAERKLQNEFRNHIPAGKIEQFDKAFAAFITTIELILK